MTRLAISNIALSAYDHAGQLRHLPELGILGLEVAPSRIWHDTWEKLVPGQVEAYRKEIENAGLKVVGLHSLFFDHPELGLFEGPEVRARTLDFLVHLSSVCRDLGGRSLVYGGGRKRGGVPLEQAFAETIDFCHEFCRRVEGHGTCLCFEPLGLQETDFIHSALDAVRIVELVDHPAVRTQLDAKALVANGEVGPEVFAAAHPTLVHFHANDPGLVVLGSTGEVDHATLGGLLRSIGYTGFVSMEQRMLNTDNPLSDVAISARLAQECYGTGSR